MKLRYFVLLLSFSLGLVWGAFAQSGKKFTLVIHGGAGTIKKENMSDELEQQYREKLTEALQSGYHILEKGGTSLEAISVSIQVLEDSPLFNAGKGAVYTNDGKNELDASVMDGKTLNAGAVAGVTTIRNPVEAAIAVMEHSPHVMMAREGAELFAKEQGLEMVEPSYFRTERRQKQLERAKDAEKDRGMLEPAEYNDFKFGTVGAAALDQHGNLAAGTSTGGMTNKRYGRIGDSPVIGAGTYANNATCAVSATGHGEYFIRSVVAYDISALMEYKKWSLEKAANHVIMKKLKERGGSGGIISVDQRGNVAMPFNTAGMYRGYVKEDGTIVVKIFKD
ncbi:isoaspartyl peptidase/L-asparaginase [Rapidithrix thailandica]|uniref:Isoaspartyl peptidase n=1 Tax=Rapidithrix thailandica TaxID=413964 RepID=A0AAW9SE57_9BACT